MAEFATKGVAGAGLGLGIGGTALGLLNGGLGNLLGGFGMNGCSDNIAVNRYEMGKENEIAQLKMEKALLESNIYTDQKIADVYEKLSGRIRCVENEIQAQAVINAKSDAALGCISGQVAQLYSLTKLIVPSTSICPEPMPAKNAWVAPTAA